MINSGTQPIQNLSVMNHHSSDQKEKSAWSKYFIDKGLKGEENTKLSLNSATAFLSLCIMIFKSKSCKYFFQFQLSKKFWSKHLVNTALAISFQWLIVVLFRRCTMRRGNPIYYLDLGEKYKKQSLI